MPLRETRRFKTKGFVISFGDFMLPLVGLVAIGLLLVAGKIFFFTDFQPGNPRIPETIAPPVIPKDTPRADAGEGVNIPPSEPSRLPSPSRSAGGNLVMDLAQNTGTQANPVVTPNNPTRSDAPQGSAGDTERIDIIVVQPQPPQPQARPTQANQKTLTQTPPRPALQKPRTTQNPGPVASTPVEPQPAQPNWMVQVGAFSTLAAAENVVKRVAQTGHTSAVISGKTLHRVLVQAGPTKQDAYNLATKLGQGEFPGAFVVPPRP